MRSRIRTCLLVALICGLTFTATVNAGEPALNLKSGGPIAFGPDGVLLVADPMEATVYAVQTGDTQSGEVAELKIENIRAKIGAMMGGEAKDVRINDLAVNPISKNTYLSVSRGAGKSRVNAILRVPSGSEDIEEFSLEDLSYTKSVLPNAIESRQTRRGNLRMFSVTDIAFVENTVYVAGLSNEEFASTLRKIPYPFEGESIDSGIEIYHGAHGRYETRSPIQTFAAYDIEGEANLLAAYTCTPLVRIPVGTLKAKTKVKGTTIAELGNRNRPLDIVVYQKDQKDYALIANSVRGVMKMDLSAVAEQEEIVTRVSRGGTAGVAFESLKELGNVRQLDGLGDSHAIVLVRDGDNNEHLKTIPLP